MNKYLRIYSVSALIILIDQAIKLSVYAFMDMGPYGEIKLVGDLFKLHYTLNPGMAFGIELGTSYGKLILTTFRIIAIAGIAYYLYQLIQKEAPIGFQIAVAMIMGGALGNVIDSVFYGVLLDNAPYSSPSPWFHGQVIDMFYLDIWEGMIPSWIPIVGDQYYSLWPIFNVADASIFVSVIFILLNQKRFLTDHSPSQKM